MSRRDRRLLIVNADDLGRSRGINAGVARAHEEGIVTSASFMVRWPAAEDGAEYARANPDLGVGLHADLGEWKFENGRWVSVDEVVPLDDEGAVEAEIRKQLDTFRRLVGRDPTHLDSHQHVHTQNEAVEGSFRRLAGELGVHLRQRSPQVRYCGDFYGQTATGTPQPEHVQPERLIEIIRGLPPGATELACHPGEGPEIDSAYARERELELRALCDPRVRATIEDERIALGSFADVEAGAA